MCWDIGEELYLGEEDDDFGFEEDEVGGLRLFTWGWFVGKVGG